MSGHHGTTMAAYSPSRAHGANLPPPSSRQWTQPYLPSQHPAVTQEHFSGNPASAAGTTATGGYPHPSSYHRSVSSQPNLYEYPPSANNKIISAQAPPAAAATVTPLDSSMHRQLHHHHQMNPNYHHHHQGRAYHLHHQQHRTSNQYTTNAPHHLPTAPPNYSNISTAKSSYPPPRPLTQPPTTTIGPYSHLLVQAQKELDARNFMISISATSATGSATTTTTATTEEPVAPASAKPSRFAQFIKSPITMCFEQMLGAAALISTSKKKKKTTPSVMETATTSSMISTATAQDQENAQPNHAPVRLEEKFHSGSKRPVSDVAEPTNALGTEAPVSGPSPFDELEADPKLARQVILHMALQRNLGDDGVATHLEESPTTSATKTVIDDGFYWRDFPCCEHVLYKHMAEYYGVSSVQRQSKIQQNFNRMLVQQVQEAAKDAGLVFAANFTEKKLRDRIRCFYKTHLQNAKKRLATLSKYPDESDNQSILRVYIRCVREDISFEESLKQEEETNALPRKRGRVSQIEKAKQALKAHQCKTSLS